MQRSTQIIRVGVVGIIANTLLAVAKLIIGQLVRSAAIVSDGLNNLTDGLSSIVTIIGTKLAGRKPDREHPFGHGRLEYVTTAAVGLIILVTGAFSLADSIQKIIAPEDTHYDVVSTLIIAAAIVVKLILGRYTERQGKMLRAESLVGAGKDALFDAAASSTILIGMAISFLWGLSIDAWLSAFIAVLIIKSGIDVLREGLDDIQGRRLSPETAKELKAVIGSFPRVEGVYDLVLDRYGPDRIIGTVHIQVPDDMTARQIDSVSRDITAAMYEKFGIIMTVGIYAANTHDTFAAAVRSEAEHIVKSEPYILQMHGFYLDETKRLISLDLVIDFAAGEKTADVCDSVRDELRALYPDYTVWVNQDTDFGGVNS